MILVVSICLLVLAVLGHGYFWTDAVNQLHAWSGPRKLIDLLTLCCFLAFLILPLAVLMQWGDVRSFREAQSSVSYEWVHFYFLFCSGWGVFSLIVNGWRWYVTDNPRTLLDHQRENVTDLRRQRDLLMREGLPQFLAKVPGNETLQLMVDRKRIAIPRLNARHQGLRIAHISELHMTGRIGLKWYQTVAEQVNQLQADVIMITGDIVEKEACWPWLAETLGTLRAEQGVFFVLGNHDFYIDTNQTKKLLGDQGLTCLSERWMEVDWKGASVILGGNERPWSPRAADLSSAPDCDDQQLPLKVLLLHSPDQFTWACSHDADLVLAGHTHGGQLRFPLLGPIMSPSRHGTRYACGVFRRGNTVMHVSRGIAGKTPLRWNCPPEIALLELVRA